jgi:hypothetical protein
MPVERNSRIMRVPNPEDRVWRYMRFVRFKQLVETGHLFFPSYRMLDDSYEMTLDDNRYTRMVENQKEHIIVSCWSLNRYEQYNLWTTYLRGNKEGVAIVTTYNDLCNSFEEYPYNIIPGIVKYQNSLNERILIRDHPNGGVRNYYRYVFYKKKYFTLDNELRLFRYHFIPNGIIPTMDPVENGLNIPCNLHHLINYVVLSPFVNKYFSMKVKKLLDSNNLHDINIKKSSIKINQ